MYYGGPNTQATDGQPWGTYTYTITYGQTATNIYTAEGYERYAPPRREPYYETTPYDGDLEALHNSLRRWQELIDTMACQGQRMPPVAVDLASLPRPAPPINARVAGAGWHRRCHGGPRERASHRRVLRTWERAA